MEPSPVGSLGRQLRAVLRPLLADSKLDEKDIDKLVLNQVYAEP
jgi:hypothetical protein